MNKHYFGYDSNRQVMNLYNKDKNLYTSTLFSDLPIIVYIQTFLAVTYIPPRKHTGKKHNDENSFFFGSSSSKAFSEYLMILL